MDCENCGNADMSFSAEWLGHHVCYECNQRGFGLASDYRARAEKAEAERDEARRERDEARAQAVWSIHVNAPIGWVACAPGGGGEGLRLVDGAWVEQTMCISEGTRFSTEAEALSAGLALPWWEVKA